MHPMCYFRTDNIQVMGPFPASEWATKQLSIETEIDTARHARLDEICEHLGIRDHRGPRYPLKIRRIRLHHHMAAVRRRAQEGAFVTARRAAFIGPLTIAQQNGHPF